MHEPARDDTVPEETLASGELRRSFSLARAQSRPPRWLMDVAPNPSDLDRRLAEVRERETRVEKREQAVARWFRDLSREQRRLEEARRQPSA